MVWAKIEKQKYTGCVKSACKKCVRIPDIKMKKKDSNNYRSKNASFSIYRVLNVCRKVNTILFF